MDRCPAPANGDQSVATIFLVPRSPPAWKDRARAPLRDLQRRRRRPLLAGARVSSP